MNRALQKLRVQRCGLRNAYKAHVISKGRCEGRAAAQIGRIFNQYNKSRDSKGATLRILKVISWVDAANKPTHPITDGDGFISRMRGCGDRQLGRPAQKLRAAVSSAGKRRARIEEARISDPAICVSQYQAAGTCVGSRGISPADSGASPH